MGGSARKPDKPRPSYEDGKPRDPDVARMLRERGAEKTDVQKVIRKAATRKP